MVMVVVAIHVGNLQLDFENGGFNGHICTFRLSWCRFDLPHQGCEE
jgi:hypothetical protein